MGIAAHARITRPMETIAPARVPGTVKPPYLPMYLGLSGLPKAIAPPRLGFRFQCLPSRQFVPAQPATFSEDEDPRRSCLSVGLGRECRVVRSEERRVGKECRSRGAPTAARTEVAS